MVTIMDQIIEELSAHEFTVPVKKVVDIYSPGKPDYPMITVNEIRNIPQLILKKEEVLSMLGYQFEIYARDAKVNGKLMTKRQIVMAITMELDEYLLSHYNLVRTGDPATLPYGSDGSILRNVVRYQNTIDTRTNYLYQK